MSKYDFSTELYEQLHKEYVLSNKCAHELGTDEQRNWLAIKVMFSYNPTEIELSKKQALLDAIYLTLRDTIDGRTATSYMRYWVQYYSPTHRKGHDAEMLQEYLESLAKRNVINVQPAENIQAMFKRDLGANNG